LAEDTGHPSRRAMLQGMGGIAATGMLPLPASAQATDGFPNRPLTIVVPFAPGALNDLLTRTLAQELTRRLASPVVAVNRPGSAAQIGTDFVARAAPDGYTLMMGSNGPLAELPVLKAGVPYRVPHDFTFVARVSANNPWLIASSTRLAAGTLPEVVAYAKANPGAVRYGSIGIGSGGQLAMALLEAETGAVFTHVPYAGAAPVATDLLAGNIDLGITGIGTMRPYATSDRVRMLAVTGSDRNSYFPQVPTTVEVGYPTVIADIWFGVVGPANIPAPIAERVSNEINAALNEESVKRILSTAGLEPSWLGPADFTHYATEYVEGVRRFARTAPGRAMMEDMSR
jgi:tripartite-type tricarboxylate transporter receptor subunit TctC